MTLEHLDSLSRLSLALHRFAWVQGKRSRYWLPSGKEDTAKNRIYGKAAEKASKSHENKSQKTTAKSPGILKSLEEIPGEIAHGVKSAYGKLKRRYGPTAAAGITGAGVAGLALPVPAGSVLAAAPVLAVAEASHQLRRLVGGNDKKAGKAKEPKPGESLRIAQAKHLVARDAYQAALKQPGFPPDRIAWLRGRMDKSEQDMQALTGPGATSRRSPR
jgi:hypothetical protein